ncbi:norbelladine synthase-like isoform X1 [Curcuma longa]|uniref:norbelladine synthase-like isoform X1 n=1 Tax=Curcuma longa TaxID=136217 RepID=UPI003D9F9CD1
MKGALCHELEVKLDASELWEVYSHLKLGQLVPQLLPDIFEKVELVEGDGGVGTVLLCTLAAGAGGPRYYKEKFVKIDHENRVKEAVGVEGGLLELGFTYYMIRLEIVEKESGSSIIRSTVEFEVDEEHAANAALATTDIVAVIGEAVTGYLLEKKKKDEASNC